MTEIHELTTEVPPAGGRRRHVWVAAGIVAVLGAAGVGAYLLPDDGATASVTQDLAPTDGVPPGGASLAVPVGYRLVGIGPAAIAVPNGWATNAAHCGTPQKDTVVVDEYVVATCLVGRPAGVESVDLTAGEARFDFVADEKTTIDGARAERQRTTCIESEKGIPLCTGTVRIPSLDANFRAESSTGSDEVDGILRRIRIVSDRIAVPGHGKIQAEEQEHSREVYADAVRAAGLNPEIRTRRVAGLQGGHVLETSPGAGTMLAPGETVVVTVSADPRGPADEVDVGMNSRNAKDEDGKSLTDAEIRTGVTLTLGVGDSVWAYAEGNRSDTLAGTLDGDSLTASTWQDDPNKGHSWVAAKKGSTKVTLFLTADGKRLELGTVTVVVR